MYTSQSVDMSNFNYDTMDNLNDPQMFMLAPGSQPIHPLFVPELSNGPQTCIPSAQMMPWNSSDSVVNLTSTPTSSPMYTNPFAVSLQDMPSSSPSSSTSTSSDATGLASTSVPNTSIYVLAASRPKLTTTPWEDEGTVCYQVDAKGVCVARRQDNDMINGTKLLNVVGMSRGKRDGILKNEKGRVVVKVGAMHLKGVWIPFARAKALADQFHIADILHPLFTEYPANFLQSSIDGNIVKASFGRMSNNDNVNNVSPPPVSSAMQGQWTEQGRDSFSHDQQGLPEYVQNGGSRRSSSTLSSYKDQLYMLKSPNALGGLMNLNSSYLMYPNDPMFSDASPSDVQFLSDAEMVENAKLVTQTPMSDSLGSPDELSRQSSLVPGQELLTFKYEDALVSSPMTTSDNFIFNYPAPDPQLIFKESTVMNNAVTFSRPNKLVMNAAPRNSPPRAPHPYGFVPPMNQSKMQHYSFGYADDHTMMPVAMMRSSF